eukprot:TRINITY_DN1126_c0_g1_i2.p1 TRINITY_DN1126_c0_g1~~TRINITY_DN1126_c0_g1_i2.p1  ORF type:complete len:193 (+),score=36.90 TRINITY_DN1126_c0_g1_i2:502-1080(+)
MPTAETVRLARFGYYGWIYSIICLVYNIIALGYAMLAGGDSKNIGSFILSFFYCALLVPIWFLVYRGLYRACRKRKPSLFVVFFIFFGLEELGYIGYAIGWRGTGAGGFWVMKDLFDDDHKVAGFVVLASAILWSLAAIWGLVIFWFARVEYSKSGGFQQAKKEMGRAAANEAVKHPDLVIEGAKQANKMRS